MKPKFTIIGSGFSASILALELLNSKISVEIIDIGLEPDKITNIFKDKNLIQIKKNKDFDKFFFGKNFENIINYNDEDLFKISPYKKKNIKKKNFNNFNEQESYDIGGHGNSWGLNVHSFNQNDLSLWPNEFNDFEIYIKKALKYFNISGKSDDLDLNYPINFINSKCFTISDHDKLILRTYNSHKNYFNKNNFKMGTSRLAINMDNYNKDEIKKLWWVDQKNIGFNVRNSVLKKCFKFPNFSYQPNRKVLHFDISDNKAISVTFFETIKNKKYQKKIDNLVLSAGAIGSGKILSNSIYINNKYKIKLPMMDTNVLKIPFINLKMIFKKESVSTIPFNRIVSSYLTDNLDYPSTIHIEVMTFQNLLINDISKKIPFGHKFSTILASRLSRSLGVASIFFPEKINKLNYLKLNKYNDFDYNYEDSIEKLKFEKKISIKIKLFLIKLSCVPIMSLKLIHGSGIHYAGTLPFGKRDYQLNSNYKINKFKNVFVGDSSSFSSLPSKSITFNIVANAIRVAERLKKIIK